MTGQAKKRKLKIVLPILILVVAIGAYIAWDRGFREHPQPDWVTQDDATRFMYGSIGAEWDAGLPYWVLYVLPRMFPEKLPGSGGLASLGFPWEQGMDLPVGFTKKTIGFPRVANNCAICHTTRYRATPDAEPVFVPLGPGQTSNIQGFLKFMIDCAKDPRFNADNIMPQILMNTKLDFIDKMLYRFFIIPIMKKRLIEREDQFQWMYNEAYPNWGHGRDDAMNLTKYFMIEVDPPDDGTYGPTDFPSIWNLKKYDSPEGDPNPQRMNLAGDTWDAYSVVVDSALGLLGAEPKDTEEFLGHVQWITDYAKQSPAPKYSYAIDTAKVESGKRLFDQNCASCHGQDSPLLGRPLAHEKVGTNKDRTDTWKKQYAVKGNIVVGDMGIERKGLVEEELIGYNVPHLDGIWLRAPYLHNGSVPSIWDLLTPPDQRPKKFYRGYDVYDPTNMGFISQGPAAEKLGDLYDTNRKGNGNRGHAFGVDLSDVKKYDLIEYLKTL
ncbi:MAG: c-type cytochrome [Gammaproteobacteria bacterium]|nr:c-type cytochrome [Gammaproteobacteria bacterium]